MSRDIPDTLVDVRRLNIPVAFGGLRTFDGQYQITMSAGNGATMERPGSFEPLEQLSSADFADDCAAAYDACDENVCNSRQLDFFPEYADIEARSLEYFRDVERLYEVFRMNSVIELPPARFRLGGTPTNDDDGRFSLRFIDPD